jgi:hypothetical protein
VAEHEEVPMESAIEKPVGGRKKRQRGRHLAVGRRREPRKHPRRLWIPGDVGCRLQEGVPPCISGMAQEDPRQERYEQEPGVPQGRRHEKRLWKYPNGYSGISDQGLRQQQLGSRQI